MFHSPPSRARANRTGRRRPSEVDVAWCLQAIKGATEEHRRLLEAEQRRVPPGIPGPKSWGKKSLRSAKKKKKAAKT